jgi:DNA primase
MSLIGKPFLDELRSRLKLSEIIGSRIAVTRAGREFKACCPFHGEKTPSFTINDEKEFFHCFGCGAHGDHLGFLMRHDNLPFMEAVELLADQAGMQVPRPTPQERAKFDRHDLYHKMMEEAAKFFTSQLFDNKNADVLNYLRDRDLNDETISSFRLGYAPDDGQALRSHLKSKGYNDGDMVTLCLTKKSTRGTDDYSFFRDRVMFPVMDKKGRVVAFGGRILPESMRPINPNSNFTPPKYMNSSETPLFHKGHLVYNASNARAAANEDQPIIVAEGYADVIALVQGGFNGAVAPLGTAMTETQISLLWDMIPSRYMDDIKEPYLCFDGDNAGQKAAIRVMERILPILRPGVSARFAFMPDGQDPDDLIRQKGREAMQDVLKQSIPLHEMIWKHLSDGRDIDRPEARASLLSAIERMVLQIADRNIQQSYSQILKDKCYKLFRGTQSKSKFTPFKKKTNNTAPNIRLSRPNANQDLPARLVLGMIVHHPSLYDAYEEKLTAFYCANPSLDGLRQNVISILSDTHGITHEQLLSALIEKGIEGEQIAGLNRDMKLHAPYVFDVEASEVVETGLKELLDRIAV